MKQTTNRPKNRYWFNRGISKKLSILGMLAALPGLASAQALLHRYSFNGDVNDSVGGANGTIQSPGGPALSFDTTTNGLIFPGGTYGAGYVSLPTGVLLGTTNITVECWMTQSSGNLFAEAWDFATSTAQTFSFIPYPNRDSFHAEVGFSPNNNERDVISPILFPTNVETYVALTFNASTLAANLYTNGALIATANMPDASYAPGSYGGAAGTTDNYLGNDVWKDAQFSGEMYEFRIWNGVVPGYYLKASQLMGPSVVVDAAPTSANLSVGPNVVITGTEQANVTVQLTQTGSTALPATSDVTNWVSSNPSVATVSSSGLIQGVSVGSATITAKIAGFTLTGTVNVTGGQTLLHRYSFASDATDSVGGANGSVVPPSTADGVPVQFNNGLILAGNSTNGGISGYVTLPTGILTNTTSVTIECWVSESQANTWAEIWDFGMPGNSVNFGLIANPPGGVNGGNAEIAFTPNGGEEDIHTGSHLPLNTEQYVAMTFNAGTLTGIVYTNGVFDASNVFTSSSYVPGSFGGATGTTTNALGNDIYNDPQFSGEIYEFRIWNGALSPVYMAAAQSVGSSVIITNTVIQSLTLTVPSESVVGSATEQATVSGSVIQASDLLLTDAATNWVSSNTNILTVSQSGLVTAINGGSATISATVGGVKATSSTITVQSTAPSVTQGPTNLSVLATSIATFSVQAVGGQLTYQWSYNGTAIAGATNSVLTLSNVQTTQAGTYSVLVKNSIGSTNVSATLTVTQPVLLHRYSFVSDASDSVGGANGTIVAPGNASGQAATISHGLNLPGNTAGGYGYSGYVSLPAGILTNTASLTVECWATQTQGNTWAELWDFGMPGNSVNFGFIPYPANNGNNPEVAFTPNGGEQDVQAGTPFPSGTEQYVALTFNSSTLTGDLYTNGVLEASHTFTGNNYIPATFGGAGGTTENALGNDIYGDDQFSGTVYEFRIWNGQASQLYLTLSQIAGPGIVVTNLTPSSMAVTVTNTSLIGGQTEQVDVSATFNNEATNVTVTSSITQWSSSDTNVLTVSSNGVIKAINAGTATITATLNGGTGTSASITVQTSAPVITQQPETTGTLLAGASLNAGVSVNGTGPFVYYWYNGSTLVATVTNSSSVSIPVSQAGTYAYTVVVSNSYGTATSGPINLTVVAPSQYEQVLQQLGAIGYWPLNETSGSTAYDLIGGDNGTYTTTSLANSQVQLGQAGPGMSYFNPDNNYGALIQNGYVDIPYEAALNITNAITVVAWVNLQSIPGFGGLFGHGDDSWRMSVDSQLQPGANDGTSATGDATYLTGIDEGNWHMVVYTYSGNTNQANNGLLYVDGVAQASNSITATPAGDNLDVWIGGSPDYGTARLLTADFAYASVFKQALTPAQVAGLYAGQYVSGPQNIQISRSGSNVVLTWQSGQLLQAPTLEGPWTTNTAATSPYTTSATSGTQFFRVLVSP